MINVNASVFDPTAIATRANERFDAADTDGNGTISKGEFSEVLTARGVDGGHADEFFARLDANGDGTLSRDEQRAQLDALAQNLRSYGPASAGNAVDTISSLLERLSADDDATSAEAQTLLAQLQTSGSDRAALDNALTFLAEELPSIDVRA